MILPSHAIATLRVLCACVAFLVCLLSQTSLAALPPGANWPAWRGDGSGVSADTNLPVAWSATNGIAWRTPLPGEGSSSPIVWGRRVFVTASTDGGTNRLVLCLDSGDGRVLWQRQVVAGRIPRTDPKAGYAPATPATDGQRLYVFFDAPGLMAFDLDGKLLWTLPLGPFMSPYNIAASPVVFRDRVIQCCDQYRGGFILAAEAATGQVLWKTARQLNCQYASPLLIAHAGVWQVVASGPAVKAYDPMTGAELWSCAGLTDTVAPSPVSGEDGLVYATSGRNGPSLAIDPGGTGDVKETRMRLQVPAGGPYVPSPIFHQAVLILPADDGVLRLVTTQGEMQVAARMARHFTASPILAGDHLYWTDESGETFVMDASHLGDRPPALTLLSVNPLAEKCLASPALVGGRLFIRTAQALDCIAGSSAETSARSIIDVHVVPPAPATPADFAELRHRFESHPAADGDDIPVRLAVVAALAECRSAEAVAFLQTIAIKDPHWDVCEAAAKAVAASETSATVPALLVLADDRRPYMKIIAADGLGRLRSVEALPVLLKGVHDTDPLVRIARLHALSEIASAPAADAIQILAALQDGLADKDGPVRVAAIRGLAAIAARPDVARSEIVRALQPCVTDPNPLVAATARDTLQALAR